MTKDTASIVWVGILTLTSDDLYWCVPRGWGKFTSLLESLHPLSRLTDNSGDVSQPRVWWWLMWLRPRLSRARVNGLVRVAASHDFSASEQQCNLMQQNLSGSQYLADYENRSKFLCNDYFLMDDISMTYVSNFYKPERIQRYQQ